MTKHVHPFPGNQLRIAELDPDEETYDDDGESTQNPTADLEEANILTSEMVDTVEPKAESIALPWLETMPAGRHRLVIDIDHPVKVVPSSTPGHNHLYIDVPMSWGQAVGILEAMANAGVVEPGYVAASEARGYTSVRLPWIRKAARQLRGQPRTA